MNMLQPIQNAAAICRTIMRNGFEAYVINPPLQKQLGLTHGLSNVDIASELDFNGLRKLFPAVQPASRASAVAMLREGELSFTFWPADVVPTSCVEGTVARVTRDMLKLLDRDDELPLSMACPYLPGAADANDGFADFGAGRIAFEGLPDEALKADYLRAIRALRFSANYSLPIETNSWLSILRSVQHILDLVPVTDIMDEWRKVEAENLWKFVQLLFDSMILHGLIPELSALSRITHIKNPTAGSENVLAHTLEVMRHYPIELPYDWFGAMACLFHDVGKLITAEYSDGEYTFYHHHHVGAKVTRRILRRLRMSAEDIDLICHLVRHHMRFHFMLTDRGIRRFKAVDEYPRLIEMVRADIRARDGSYKEFNHNMKMLDRADIHEDMLEPLLNGHEIMQHAHIKPGPAVGVIRDALLQAQIAGDVTSVEEALAFVREYALREKLL